VAASIKIAAFTKNARFRAIAESIKLSSENNFTIGKYIIENYKSKAHIINTYTYDRQHFWICLKNIDMLL
jgi:hypothetical protein